MNRKDTILIAVLLNAALLVVLFATALKTDPVEGTLALEAKPEAAKVAPAPVRPAPTKPVAAVRPAAKPEPMAVQPAAPSKEMAKEASKEVVAAVVKETPQRSESKPTPEPKSSPLLQELALPARPVAAPPQTAPAAASSTAAFIEVRVKKGDSLEKIAKAHGCKVDELMKINHLTTTRLNINQLLKVPTGRKIEAEKTALPAQVPSNHPEHYYTVKPGDSPWTIAQKHNINVDELLRLNNLDPEKARQLKPGDRLRVK